jgi:hypothetical protein
MENLVPVENPINVSVWSKLWKSQKYMSFEIQRALPTRGQGHSGYHELTFEQKLTYYISDIRLIYDLSPQSTRKPNCCTLLTC